MLFSTLYPGRNTLESGTVGNPKAISADSLKSLK